MFYNIYITVNLKRYTSIGWIRNGLGYGIDHFGGKPLTSTSLSLKYSITMNLI